MLPTPMLRLELKAESEREREGGSERVSDEALGRRGRGPPFGGPPKRGEAERREILILSSKSRANCARN